MLLTDNALFIVTDKHGSWADELANSFVRKVVEKANAAPKCAAE
jgi:hypothetical protein